MTRCTHLDPYLRAIYTGHLNGDELLRVGYQVGPTTQAGHPYPQSSRAKGPCGAREHDAASRLFPVRDT